MLGRSRGDCLQWTAEQLRLSDDEVAELKRQVMEWYGKTRSVEEKQTMSNLFDLAARQASGHVGLLKLSVCNTFDALARYSRLFAMKDAMSHYLSLFKRGGPVRVRCFPLPLAPPDDGSCSEGDVEALLRDVIEGKDVSGPSSAGVKVDERFYAARWLVRNAFLVQHKRTEATFDLRFASALHKQTALLELYPHKSVRPLDPSKVDIDAFVEHVLLSFEPRLLGDVASALASNKISKETPLQHQFWRGASSLLTVEDCRLAAEVSKLEAHHKQIHGASPVHCW